MRCDVLVFLMLWSFVTTLQTWLQTIVACVDDAMCCFSGMLWSFVTTLQTWLQKIVACAMMRWCDDAIVRLCTRWCDAMCCFSGMLWSFVTTLCSPNEDFGRMNKLFRLHFRSTFQRFVAQILSSHPLKVLRKCSLKCLFILPKSSFGSHRTWLEKTFRTVCSAFPNLRLGGIKFLADIRTSWADYD